jgi:hypothetical protein
MEPLDQEKEDVVMEEIPDDIETPEMSQRIATDVKVVPMKDRKVKARSREEDSPTATRTRQSFCVDDMDVKKT